MTALSGPSRGWGSTSLGEVFTFLVVAELLTISLVVFKSAFHPPGICFLCLCGRSRAFLKRRRRRPGAAAGTRLNGAPRWPAPQPQPLQHAGRAWRTPSPPLREKAGMRGWGPWVASTSSFWTHIGTMNRSSRREEALTSFCTSSLSLLTSAATNARFMEGGALARVQPQRGAMFIAVPSALRSERDGPHERVGLHVRRGQRPAVDPDVLKHHVLNRVAGIESLELHT
jgi:hypothetical protein